MIEEVAAKQQYLRFDSWEDDDGDDPGIFPPTFEERDRDLSHGPFSSVQLLVHKDADQKMVLSVLRSLVDLLDGQGWQQIMREADDEFGLHSLKQ